MLLYLSVNSFGIFSQQGFLDAGSKVKSMMKTDCSSVLAFLELVFIM